MSGSEERLKDRVAVVTGGGSGIGRAITEDLAAAGCKVVIAARNEERLEAAAEEIGANVSPVGCDVSDEAQVEALLEEVDARHGRIDILVNNAGLAVNRPTHELPVEDWKHVLDVNLTGVFLCSKHALKRMIPQRSGRILNIGSISGTRPRPNAAAYTTSKFGLEGLTHSMALDAREHGIAVSLLNPGNVPTDIWGHHIEAVTQAEGMIPVEDVARIAIAMLTMDDTVNVLSSVILPVSQPFLGRG